MVFRLFLLDNRTKKANLRSRYKEGTGYVLQQMRSGDFEGGQVLSTVRAEGDGAGGAGRTGPHIARSGAVRACECGYGRHTCRRA